MVSATVSDVVSATVSLRVWPTGRVVGGLGVWIDNNPCVYNSLNTGSFCFEESIHFILKYIGIHLISLLCRL